MSDSMGNASKSHEPTVIRRPLDRCPTCGSWQLRAVTHDEGVRFLCGSCDRCWHVELGFVHLLFHAPGKDQARFLHAFSEDVLPRLVERFGGSAVSARERTA